MKFSIKDFFGKYDQIRSKFRIWSHLQEKSLAENFNFCAVPVLKDLANLTHKTSFYFKLKFLLEKSHKMR